MFYIIENKELQDKYKEYLKLTGSLSRLFSDSLAPYLYYRAAENIFCLAFEAENLSRSDISIDAKKGNIGFGLKTFLHGNGKTFQKIAEFNAIRNEYANKSDKEIVEFISKSRNKRLDICLEGYGVDTLIYHCLTRCDNLISIYEFSMDMIQIDKIKNITRNTNTIQFEDGLHQYSFNLSKSTLYKRFICENSLEDIKVDILENPFEALGSLNTANTSILKEVSSYPFIYLPLYAPSSKELEPASASGINQWNSKPREGQEKRNDNELYIPIPAWIHKKFEGFFPDNNEDKFELELPNGEILNAKMCQSGQKGLMSNPNKALGKWVLRDVLKVPVGTLVDRKYLDMIGIDSVIVFKLDDTKYKIDFASSGKFEEFKGLNL